MIHGMQIIKLIDALFELDWMEFLGLPQVKLHNHFLEFPFNNALATTRNENRPVCTALVK